jgi:DNA-binding NarL/FixJ family response regulator
MKFRVAIVDDHALLREGLLELFTEAPDFEVVGEGGTADEAVQIALDEKPDLIILDVSMPGGGVEAARRIQDVSPGVKTMMFSFRGDARLVSSSLSAGAKGYVVKGVLGPDLLVVARDILAGRHFDSPIFPAAH